MLPEDFKFNPKDVCLNETDGRVFQQGQKL